MLFKKNKANDYIDLLKNFKDFAKKENGIQEEIIQKNKKRLCNTIQEEINEKMNEICKIVEYGAKNEIPLKGRDSFLIFQHGKPDIFLYLKLRDDKFDREAHIYPDGAIKYITSELNYIEKPTSSSYKGYCDFTDFPDEVLKNLKSLFSSFEENFYKDLDEMLKEYQLKMAIDQCVKEFCLERQYVLTDVEIAEYRNEVLLWYHNSFNTDILCHVKNQFYAFLQSHPEIKERHKESQKDMEDYLDELLEELDDE